MLISELCVGLKFSDFNSHLGTFFRGAKEAEHEHDWRLEMKGLQ